MKIIDFFKNAYKDFMTVDEDEIDYIVERELEFIRRGTTENMMSQLLGM